MHLKNGLFYSYMKKNNASAGLKRKTFRSHFSAKLLLSKLKSKDAKDEIIHFLEDGGEAKSPQGFSPPE